MRDVAPLWDSGLAGPGRARLGMVRPGLASLGSETLLRGAGALPGACRAKHAYTYICIHIAHTCDN